LNSLEPDKAFAKYPAIIQLDMNHADPGTMRARARQAIEILKTQLLQTGTVEPLVALYFDDYIEQVQFEDTSVLDHFDMRTARSFDYLRTLVRIRTPQAAMLTLDVRMRTFENDERDVVAEKTAIFLMLDSPLLTIQVILPYARTGGTVAVSEVHYTEMPGDEDASPCRMFKIFSDAPLAVC
jgi:hypothetical protein